MSPYLRFIQTPTCKTWGPVSRLACSRVALGSELLAGRAVFIGHLESYRYINSLKTASVIMKCTLVG